MLHDRRVAAAALALLALSACSDQSPTSPRPDHSSVRVQMELSGTGVDSQLRTTTKEPSNVEVAIGPRATLLSDGFAVEVEVEVACVKQSDVLEAFVYIVQESNQSQFARIPVKCAGTAREYVVKVLAYSEAPFQVGTAHASAYVLVHHRASGAYQSGGDSRPIEIR